MSNLHMRYSRENRQLMDVCVEETLEAFSNELVALAKKKKVETKQIERTTAESQAAKILVDISSSHPPIPPIPSISSIQSNPPLPSNDIDIDADPPLRPISLSPPQTQSAISKSTFQSITSTEDSSTSSLQYGKRDSAGSVRQYTPPSQQPPPIHAPANIVPPPPMSLGFPAHNLRSLPPAGVMGALDNSAVISAASFGNAPNTSIFNLNNTPSNPLFGTIASSVLTGSKGTNTVSNTVSNSAGSLSSSLGTPISRDYIFSSIPNYTTSSPTVPFRNPNPGNTGSASQSIPSSTNTLSPANYNPPPSRPPPTLTSLRPPSSLTSFLPLPGTPTAAMNFIQQIHPNVNVYPFPSRQSYEGRQMRMNQLPFPVVPHPPRRSTSPRYPSDIYPLFRVEDPAYRANLPLKQDGSLSYADFLASLAFNPADSSLHKRSKSFSNPSTSSAQRTVNPEKQSTSEMKSSTVESTNISSANEKESPVSESAINNVDDDSDLRSI